MFSKWTKKGFTLVELIVYVTISSIVLVTMVNFTWNIMGTEVKVDVSTELTQNARMIMEKFTQTVQGADDIDAGNSVFASHPGKLTLDYASGDMVIDTYEKTITLGGQELIIKKLRLKEGAADAVDITSDTVDIKNFVITNMSRGDDAKSVKLELTLEYVNTDENFPWNTDLALETSATIRKR